MFFNISKRWSEPIPSNSQCWVFSKSPCIVCPFWRGQQQMLCYRMTASMFLTWHGAPWQASLSLCIGARGAASRFITGSGWRTPCWLSPAGCPLRLAHAPRPPQRGSCQHTCSGTTSCYTPWGQSIAWATQILERLTAAASKKKWFHFLLGDELKHQPRPQTTAPFYG